LHAVRLLMILVVSLLVPSAGHAKECPADPYKASEVVWAWGALIYGSPVTAMHPCGRKITCIGGNKDPGLPGGQHRKCYWH
jgi:hypothetical protein